MTSNIAESDLDNLWNFGLLIIELGAFIDQIWGMQLFSLLRKAQSRFVTYHTYRNNRINNKNKWYFSKYKCKAISKILLPSLKECSYRNLLPIFSFCLTQIKCSLFRLFWPRYEREARDEKIRDEKHRLRMNGNGPRLLTGGINPPYLVVMWLLSRNCTHIFWAVTTAWLKYCSRKRGDS